MSSSRVNNQANVPVNEVTVPKLNGRKNEQGNVSVSSKSTTSSTRRENERLRLENEKLKLKNRRLKKAIRTRTKDSKRSKSRHSNDSTGSIRSNIIRRANESICLENERLRSDLVQSQQNFQAILRSIQTNAIPSAAPVPDIEVEVLRGHDNLQMQKLKHLVEVLKMENADLRSLVGKWPRYSEASVVSSTLSTPSVEPSLWERHRTKILVGGTVLFVTAARTAVCFYWPFLSKRGARLAQMLFEAGVRAGLVIVPVPKHEVAKKATISIARSMTGPNTEPRAETITSRSIAEAITAGSIAGAIVGMLQISQNGVGR